MPKFIDQSDLNKISENVISEINEKGLLKTGELVGYVTNGDSFPTKRPDGSPLKDFDYVHPEQDSEFPFDVEGLTFNNVNDIGYIEDGIWYMGTSAVTVFVAQAKAAAAQAKAAAIKANTYSDLAEDSAVEADNSATLAGTKATEAANKATAAANSATTASDKATAAAASATQSGTYAASALTSSNNAATKATEAAAQASQASAYASQAGTAAASAIVAKEFVEKRIIPMSMEEYNDPTYIPVADALYFLYD